MLVGQLKQILKQAIANGYGNYYVILWKDDENNFTIDDVFEDSEHDVCLLSDDNAEEDTEFYAEKLLSELNQYQDDKYVYTAACLEGHQDNNEFDYVFDICEKDKDGNSDKLWYYDEEIGLCINVEERSDEEDEELDETDPIAVRAEIERLQAILKDIEGKEEIEPESEETCDDMTVGQLKQMIALN